MPNWGVFRIVKRSTQVLTLCALIATLLLSGCGREKAPKRPSLRCIYDQAAFSDLCRRAIADEECFNTFKRDVFYSLLWEGYSYEEGKEFLSTIENRYPFLLDKLDLFRANDRVGSPRIFDYGSQGVFSPTTLHHVCIAGELIEQFGDLSSRDIVQIGAGYGGLCAVIHHATQWKSYTLIDLPEHLDLARKVLENQGIEGVRYLTLQEIPKNAHWDLAISDCSFSEFTRPLQEMMIDQLLVHADQGYLACHVFPKHFGVIPLDPFQLKEYCEKKKITPVLKWEDPQGLRSQYFLVWNQNFTG